MASAYAWVCYGLGLCLSELRPQLITECAMASAHVWAHYGLSLCLSELFFKTTPKGVRDFTISFHLLLMFTLSLLLCPKGPWLLLCRKRHARRGHGYYWYWAGSGCPKGPLLILSRKRLPEGAIIITTPEAAVRRDYFISMSEATHGLDCILYLRSVCSFALFT